MGDVTILYRPVGPKELALIEASQNKIGSRVDAVLLFCFHYDPTTGKYGLAVMRVLRTAAASTVFVLGISIGLMLRRERQLRLKA